MTHSQSLDLALDLDSYSMHFVGGEGYVVYVQWDPAITKTPL